MKGQKGRPSKKRILVWSIVYVAVLICWIVIDYNYHDFYDYPNIKWYPRTVLCRVAESAAFLMTVWLLVLYYRFFKQDRLEFLKPMCVALLIFAPLFHVFAGSFFSSSSPASIDRTWIFVIEWLLGVSVVVLSVIYLVKSRKQDRKKIFMAVCLVLGIIWTLLGMIQA